MSDRARRGLRPRLPAATRASAPAAGRGGGAIWRDGDPHLARARARRRREDRAVAPARASRSCRWSSSSCVAAFVGARRRTRTTSSFRRTPTTTSCAIVPLGLFAAVVAPLLVCPDRRDGVLSLYAARPITPLDYVGVALGGVPHRRRWRRPGCPRRSSSPGTRSTREHPGRGSATTGTSCRGSSLAGALVAVVLTTLALLRRVVRDAARVRGGRDARRALHRLRDRRHRRGQLLRRASRTRSRSRASRRRSPTPSTGSSATTLEPAAVRVRVARSGSSG